LILPAIVLSLLQIALFSRFMRSSLLEVLGTDYMRTAAAKGLSFRTILYKHGLKNALIPVVTSSRSRCRLLAGAIVTENDLRVARDGPAVHQRAHAERPRAAHGVSVARRHFSSCSPTFSPTSCTRGSIRA
jgi:hypothetical protein